METVGGKKIVVIGLDCLEPSLVGRWIEELPNFRGLIKGGISGPLRSTDPPITVPAWMSMMTGKSPGTLGFYGFRNRSDYSYDRLSFATSVMVREKTVWDYLSDAGKKVILLCVPQTYPPKRVNGCMVSGFLAPDTESDYTYPRELKGEIESVVGDFMLDVENFRTDDKERLLSDIYRLSEQRFTLARHFLTTKEWDFFMMVDMGTDRLHHGFWKFFDRTHPKYVSGNPLEDTVKDYYIFLDTRVGELLASVPDDAAVFVVSDHGAQPMMGAVAINEWLIERGYLAVKEYPGEATPIGRVEIDWEKTRVWGEGGYYCRLFLNVKDREPTGIIEKDEYDAFRDRIITEITEMTDEGGNPLGNACFRPEDLYEERRGIPPDLLVYFGNLSYRSVGSIGLGRTLVSENDTGPDDANHSFHGFFCLTGAKQTGKRADLSIYDVAPTILSLAEIEVPTDMKGKTIT
jgi:predicted AlkP superfamily phosphohydrolase/phosphomutase